MTGPPGPGQPWWARPGGAPMQGRPPTGRRRHGTGPPTPPRHRGRRHPCPASNVRRSARDAGCCHLGGRRDRRVVEAWCWSSRCWYVRDLESRVLDVRQAEAGVKQILSDPINGYGANDVKSVKCNNGERPDSRTRQWLHVSGDHQRCPPTSAGRLP